MSRSIAVGWVALVILAWGTLPSQAQEARIGLYFDAAGTQYAGRVEPFTMTDVYVILETTEPVDFVTYCVDFTSMGAVSVQEVAYGPTGSGSARETTSGTQVNLGGCIEPDANGRVTVARYTLSAIFIDPFYGFLRLGCGSGASFSLPSVHPCAGDWTDVDHSWVSLVPPSHHIVQPAPGDEVEATSLAFYTHVFEGASTMDVDHQYSVDGGTTWSVVERTQCIAERGVEFCLWPVPNVRTRHARVRIVPAGDSFPDPGREELEFEIFQEVSAAQESWSAVKARY